MFLKSYWDKYQKMDIYTRLPDDIQYNIKRFIRPVVYPNENMFKNMNSFHNVKILMISILSRCPRYSCILESNIDIIDHTTVLSNHGMYDYLVQKYRNTTESYIIKCLLKYNKYCVSILFKDCTDVLKRLYEKGLSKYLFTNKHIDYILQRHNIDIESLSSSDLKILLQNNHSTLAKQHVFLDHDQIPNDFLFESSVCVEHVRQYYKKMKGCLSSNEITLLSKNKYMIPLLEDILLEHDIKDTVSSINWNIVSKYCTHVHFVERFYEYIKPQFLSENSNMIQYLGQNIHLISWDTLVLNNPNISQILENEYILPQYQFQLLLLTVTHYSNTTFDELIFLCKLFKDTPLVDICNLVLLQQHCSEKVMRCNVNESIIFESHASNIFEHLF